MIMNMGNDTQALIAQADRLLGMGKNAEALLVLEKISGLEPGNTDAWMMRAAILGEQGRLDEAIDCCRKTIALDPGDGDAHVMLGRLLTMHGRLDEAQACLESVVKLDAEYGEAWCTLSSVYLAQGRFVEAEKSSREAIRCLPDLAEAYVNYANSLVSQGRRDEVVAVLSKAGELEPNNPMLWCTAGVILERAGNLEAARDAYKHSTKLASQLSSAQAGLARVHCALGEISSAEHVLGEALKLQPNDTVLHCAMGAFCESRGDLARAESHYRQALDLDSGLVQAWINLGNVQQNQERHAEAERTYQAAIQIDPGHAEAHFNLGVLYQKLRLYGQALVSLDRAIECKPELVEAHWYKAFISLLLGDYKQGLDEYEWRLRQKENIPRPFVQPVWGGEDLNGTTILVHDEQGYGDTFQFARYLPLVKARGARVVFECHPKLSAVLKGLDGYDEIVERVSPHHVPQVEFDTHIHLMSLPRVFNTRLESVPQAVPYIKADPERVQYWRRRVQNDGNFKVGLAWSSAGSIRSCNLSNFQPLAEIPGISLYSLQKGPGAEQADSPPAGMDLIRIDRELDQAERFVDTAAVMMSLDLIVSVDTSIVHLGGALGCPVWTILSAAPDWRWTSNGETTPWYPTMRLFRQDALGDWSGVFARVKAALAQALERREG